MSRFRKGTNDADGNGRKGGSMKDNPKTPKAAKRKVAAKKVAVADQFAEADAKAAPDENVKPATKDPNAEIDALQVGLQVRGY